MRVVSFYTNKRYKDECDKLHISAKHLGLIHVSKEMPDLGSWTNNVNQKATVILNAMREFRDDIFYVDADARFLRYPELLDECPFDVAAYYDEPHRPCGSVLFFKNTQISLGLLLRWESEIRTNPTYSDDSRNLVSALKKIGIKAWHLPPAYNWDSSMADRFPRAIPVVYHYRIGEHSYEIS